MKGVAGNRVVLGIVGLFVGVFVMLHGQNGASAQYLYNRPCEVLNKRTAEFWGSSAGIVPAGDVRWVTYRNFPRTIGKGWVPGFELVVTMPAKCYILRGLFSQQNGAIVDRCLRLAEQFVEDSSINGLLVARNDRWSRFEIKVAAGTDDYLIINSCGVKGEKIQPIWDRSCGSYGCPPSGFSVDEFYGK